VIVDDILRRYPDARVVMIDLASDVGRFIHPSRLDRVDVHPQTSLADYRAKANDAPDVILLSDVVHHVPAAEREAFCRDVARFIHAGRTTLAVKDIAPVGFRSRLSLLADRYVTGDRGVTLVDQDEMRRMFEAAIPACAGVETDLFRRDAPNYMLLFTQRTDE
jgi:hypothetical protein